MRLECFSRRSHFVLCVLRHFLYAGCQSSVKPVAVQSILETPTLFSEELKEFKITVFVFQGPEICISNALICSVEDGPTLISIGKVFCSFSALTEGELGDMILKYGQFPTLIPNTGFWG